jgi:hypothetical protein
MTTWSNAPMELRSTPASSRRSDGIAAASHVIRTAIDDGRSRRRQALQSRAGIAAIDALLEIVERRHLDGEPRDVRMPAPWRNLLEGAGLSIPAHVLRAPTTVELHERLLDWQDALLEAASPLRVGIRSAEGEGLSLLSLLVMYPAARPRAALR